VGTGATAVDAGGGLEAVVDEDELEAESAGAAANGAGAGAGAEEEAEAAGAPDDDAGVADDAVDMVVVGRATLPPCPFFAAAAVAAGAALVVIESETVRVPTVPAARSHLGPHIFIGSCPSLW
jgi:hypothetical protein